MAELFPPVELVEIDLTFPAFRKRLQSYEGPASDIHTRTALDFLLLLQKYFVAEPLEGPRERPAIASHR